MKKNVMVILIATLLANLSFADNHFVNKSKPIDRLFLSKRIITGNDLQKQREAFVKSVARTNNYTDYLPLTAGSGSPLTGTLYQIVPGGYAVQASPATGTDYVYYNFSNTSGAIYMGVESSVAGSFITGSSAYDAVIGTGSGKSLRFATANTARYTIDNSGNNTWTGSGTFGGAITTGGAITSTMGNNAVILNSISATTGYQYINIANTSGWLNAGVESSAGNTIFYGSLPYSTVLGNGSNRSLHLATNNTVRYTIDGSGNIGIGTTSPNSPLEIKYDGGTGIPADQVRISSGVSGHTASLHLTDGVTSDAFLSFIPSATSTSRRISISDGSTEILSLRGDGNVGIGTITPSEKLSVYGNIRSAKMIVTQSGWPDYVFDPSFKLRPLLEVEQFIKENNHLPDVPSAKEIEKGVDLGATETILLKKVEELTLYIIAQDKRISELEKKQIKNKIQ